MNRSEVNKVISLIATVVFVLIVSKFAIGILDGDTKEEASSQTSSQVSQVVAQSTVLNSQVPTQTPSSSEVATSTLPTQNPASSEVVSTTVPVTNAVPTSVEEILALYSNSANKVKTSAKEVVRNFEKIDVLEDKFVMNEAIGKYALPVINTVVKSDMKEIHYDNLEDIKKNFQPKGQTYSCIATVNEIESATCTDDGSNYNVELFFKDVSNPADGTSIYTAFTGASATAIKEKTSMVKEATVDYFDCKITATIDKATGNLTSATYFIAIVTKVKAGPSFALMEMEMGVSSETLYTISY